MAFRFGLLLRTGMEPGKVIAMICGARASALTLWRWQWRPWSGVREAERVVLREGRRSGVASVNWFAGLAAEAPGARGMRIPVPQG